jgi:hypothetical protein
MCKPLAEKSVSLLSEVPNRLLTEALPREKRQNPVMLGVTIGEGSFRAGLVSVRLIGQCAYVARFIAVRPLHFLQSAPVAGGFNPKGGSYQTIKSSTVPCST